MRTMDQPILAQRGLLLYLGDASGSSVRAGWSPVLAGYLRQGLVRLARNLDDLCRLVREVTDGGVGLLNADG
jgi:hypothetical protein